MFLMRVFLINESVLHEVHPLPTVDETLAQMAGAAVFSELDANCGFWQIPLHENSQKLTTFIPPFGRFYFKRLPFRISSAPEYFQWRMSAILAGHKSVLCHMDVIFIFGCDQCEHDAHWLPHSDPSKQLESPSRQTSRRASPSWVTSSTRMGFRRPWQNSRGLADDHTLQHYRTSSVLRNGEPT